MINRAGLLFFVVISGCTKAPGSSVTGDSAAHAGMSTDRHEAMHGADTASLSDSAFEKLQQRGGRVMGVDQYTSSHKFDITPDGGRIELQRNTTDSMDIAEIRSHMRDIEKAFRSGDFAKPFAVHDREMPGTRVMTNRRSAIQYVYHELPRGAELRLVTTDSAVRAAIADFIRAQRAEHRSTGQDVPRH
ncbi:MAG TPA: hypothetical protein VHM24_05690 [Gemmatimonadaceae bacterium]|nr:hypothetical protein [Gemmatimonadaceae bacterium]